MPLAVNYSRSERIATRRFGPTNRCVEGTGSLMQALLPSSCAETCQKKPQVDSQLAGLRMEKLLGRRRHTDCYEVFAKNSSDAITAACTGSLLASVERVRKGTQLDSAQLDFRGWVTRRFLRTSSRIWPPTRSIPIAVRHHHVGFPSELSRRTAVRSTFDSASHSRHTTACRDLVLRRYSPGR
jgi:hypothetical protein